MMREAQPTRARVLVVDDEDGIRALLTDILTDLGYEALAVADGEAAIDLLERNGAPIALAIIDLVLPGKGGIETLRALRERRPQLPGIISTGYQETATGLTGTGGVPLCEAARRERFEVLEKPYKIDALASAVERALGSL